jgi:hypothetical protein
VSDAGAPARPALAVIDAGASPEEVAAIVAAVTAALGSAAAAGGGEADVPTSGWLTAARLRARRAGLQRGGWRWSDRLGGRVTT